jgi:hypothetical protein
MAAQAAPRILDEHPGKKSGRSKKNSRVKKTFLPAVSEYSLSGFFDDEPDLYSVADIKVRYR